MIVDAKNMIAGRLATRVAKLALLGNTIQVINAEKAVITGKPQMVIDKFLAKVRKGSIRKGPYYPRHPDRLLRRIIRGMLPHRQEKGKLAYKRVMCYIGAPAELKETPVIFKESDVKKVKRTTYITLADLSVGLGVK